MIIKEYTLDNKVIYLTVLLEQYITMLSDNDRLDFVVSNIDFSSIRHERLLVRHIKPLILEKTKNDIGNYVKNSLINHIKGLKDNEESE